MSAALTSTLATNSTEAESPAGDLLSLFARALVWKGDSAFQQQDAEPTGFASLNALLPGGGWPRGALTELLHEQDGLGELSLLLPALANLCAEKRIALVSPPHIPYAPALVQAGLRLERMVVVQPSTDTDAWWSAEAMLRAGQFSAVLFWPDRFDDVRLRRLQSACEEGKGCGFVFHHTNAAQHASPAPLRVRISACTDADCVRINILKRRGGLVAAPLTLRLNGNQAINNGIRNTVSSSYVPRAVDKVRTLQTKQQSSVLKWPRIAASADTLSLSTTPDR